MEPFGGGKGERSHFLLHISQCLRPPSLRRPPGLGPASLQLLRLLLAHKLVMAFPGERSTTQGARLGLGCSASQCLPPTSPPPPLSTPPPPRLPSAPPPPHQLHGSAGQGAWCRGTRPPPPLTWGTSLSISPDTPLCPVGGKRQHSISFRGIPSSGPQPPHPLRASRSLLPPPLPRLGAATRAPPLPCGSASSRCSPPRRRARQQLAAPWPNPSAQGRKRPARLQTQLAPAGAPMRSCARTSPRARPPPPPLAPQQPGRRRCLHPPALCSLSLRQLSPGRRGTRTHANPGRQRAGPRRAQLGVRGRDAPRIGAARPTGGPRSGRQGRRRAREEAGEEEGAGRCRGGI